MGMTKSSEHLGYHDVYVSFFFNWHVTILERATSQMRMARNGHIKQTFFSYG